MSAVAPRAVVWLLSLPAIAYSALWVLTLLGWMGRWSWAGLLGWALVILALPGQRWWGEAVSRRGVQVGSRSDLALLGLTAPWGLTWWLMCTVARRVPFGRVSLTVMPSLVLGTATAQSLVAGNAAGAVVMLAALHLLAVGPLLLRRLGAPTWDARISP